MRERDRDRERKERDKRKTELKLQNKRKSDLSSSFKSVVISALFLITQVNFSK